MFDQQLVTLARVAIVCAVLTSFPGLARAVDGVIEINQAKAVAGGVTAGDAAGFPVTISASGSYVLTGNLTVGDANLDGIEVSVHDVSIDLNGFTIAGPVTCTGVGSAVNCGAGTGRGIDALFRFRVSIHNGRVRGFGSAGIIAAGEAQIRNMSVSSNGGNGITTTTQSIVRENSAFQNGARGIFTGSDSVVERNVALRNKTDGIFTENGSSIIGNAANSNGTNGIDAGIGVVVRDNSASFNEGDGIETNGGCLVSDNVSRQNGLDGIEAGSGSAVQRNTVSINTGFGLRLAADAAYRESNITGNTAGTVIGGLNMLANSCNGANTCP